MVERLEKFSDTTKKAVDALMPATIKTIFWARLWGGAKNGVIVPAVNQAAATVLRKSEKTFHCWEVSFITSLLYHGHMFGPQVLETITSPINGNLEVRRLGKDIYVTCGGLTQSGGLIRELWEKTTKVLGSRFQVLDKNWLILGLATGTVAKIISEKYQPVKIVGVEIDPLMLDIGQKYFGLDNIPNLKIINGDANLYTLRSKFRFDFVLVDLYVGDQLPKFVYQQKFLDRLGKLGKSVIVNHLFYDPDKKNKAQELVKSLESRFDQVSLVRELTNLLIICS